MIVVSIAIYDAVKRERVDGMYITATKRVNTDFWSIFPHVKVYIYGNDKRSQKNNQRKIYKNMMIWIDVTLYSIIVTY